MSYSGDEIQGAVEKLVKSSIRRPIDTLGVRRSDISFADFQEAAAGAFILNPNAPFYVVALGCSRLLEEMRGEAQVLIEVVECLEATGRTVLPIHDVSTLFNARTALRELAGAAASRMQGFKDITKVPAHVRFEDNVAQFLTSAGPAVKDGGQVVRTPAEARAMLPALVRTLKAAHESVVDKAQALAAAISDYDSVNLPSLVAAGVLARAAELVGADADALNALSSTERLEAVRGVVLNLLAAKAVVRTLGSFSGTSVFLPLTGTGMPYADAQHPAFPAELVSDVGGAYSLVAGVNDALIVTANGAPPFTLTLNPSPIAELLGSIPESDGSPNRGFLIGDGSIPAAPVGSATPKNNQLKVRVGDVSGSSTVYVLDLLKSATYSTLRTAALVVVDMNSMLPSHVRAEAVFAPLKYEGLFNVDGGSNIGNLTVPGGAGNMNALGIELGDIVELRGGLNPGLYPITGILSGGLIVSRAIGVFAAESNAPARVGDAHRRIRLYCDDPVTQVPIEQSISFVADTDATRGALATFGFVPDATSTCFPSKPEDVVDDILTKTSLLRADARFITEMGLENYPAHASLSDNQLITLAGNSGIGDVVFTGTTLVLTPTVYFPLIDPRPGDVLVLRDGPNANQTGWSITGVDVDGTITATGFAGTSDVVVKFETGPALAPIADETVRILSGPNAGDYLISNEDGPTLLDIRLKRTLPVVRNGNEPVSFFVAVGEKRVAFASKNTSTSSALSIAGNAAPSFFFSPPAHAVGTTPWMRLPSFPRGLQVGDLLELYTGQYNVPTSKHTITSVERGSSTLVGLGTPIDSTESWTFNDQPPPFARIRTGTTNDYAAFRSRLVSWLAREENQSLYFTNLNRFINPLLVSQNPTADAVGTAIGEVNRLFGRLTLLQADALDLDEESTLESILMDYTATPVEVVDTLLRAYKEKGSTRAVDLLVQGRFSVFFGLTIDGASYAGTMQAAMRDVAREDLAIRKTGRSDVTAPRALATATSPDFEYCSEDTETAGNVDVV